MPINSNNFGRKGGLSRGSKLKFSSFREPQLVTPDAEDRLLMLDYDSGSPSDVKYIEYSDLISSIIVTPSSATDEAIVRFNGTSGNDIQNSLVTIDDSGNITTPGLLTTTEVNTAAGNLTLNSTGGTVYVDDNLIIVGDLTVNGTTTTVNSTVTTIDDPIVTLGGDTAPVSNDAKDRGIEFRWHDGAAAKVGFFGFDDSTGRFTFIPDATNTNEVFSGTKGTIDVTDIYGTIQTASQTNITGLGTITVGTWNATAITDTYLATITTSNKVSLTSLDIDGGTDIGAALTTTDLLIVDDGASGTNRKTEISRLVTLFNDSAVLTAFQPLDSDLTTLAGLSHVGGEILYSNAGTWTAAAPGATSGVQPYDTELAALAGLTSAADKLPYFTGSGTADVTTLSAFARTLIDDADAATARTTLDVDQAGTDNSTDVTLAGSYDYLTLSSQEITLGQIDLTTDVTGALPVANGGTGAINAAIARSNLGVAIGSDVQAYDATLTSIASLGTASDKMLYTTGVDTWAEASLTSFARSLLDDADASAARTTLGVDAAGTDNSTDVTLAGSYDYLTLSGQQITLGQVDLTTDVTGALPVLNGGTGSTTASGARTNLGLVIGTDVQAYDAELAAIAGLTSAANKIPMFSGSGTAALIDFLDEDNMVSDSASAVASQQSVKAYVDAQIATANELTELTDVTITTVADNEVLAYDSTSSAWINQTAAEAGIVATSDIGSTVQAYDAELAAIAGLTSAADKGIQFTGSGTAATYDLTTAGKALLDDADAAAQRTTLGLVIGTDVQAYDAELNALAGLTSAANKLPMFSGSGTATVIDFLDEDTMASDSATAAASQQSIKAYVDNAILSAGSGDVVGPSSATDNAVTRFDGTTGKLVQNSGVTIDDDDAVTANEFIGPLRGAILFNARNESGVTINKGDAVYIDGINGNTPTVAKAQANSSSTMPAFGLAYETVADNNPIQIVTFGSLTGLDTSSSTYYALNQPIYVSAATAGAVTKTAPTGEGNLIQNIGFVTRIDASAGSIRVGGAGRTNATPNLDQNQIFVGNGSNQTVAADPTTLKFGNIQVGTTGTGEIDTDSGNLTIDSAGGTVTVDDNLIVAGDLTVNGTTTTVNSTVTTLDDPILTLGGDTAPSSDDNKDRGVEFRWYDGSAKVGFFGFDDSTGRFTFIPDATNTSEVFSGTKGAIDVTDIYGTLQTASQTNITEIGTITTGTWEATDVAIAHGGTGASTAADARTNLGVDAAGTDNSTDVTLAGSYNYLTIAGQAITLDQIDLTTDVTGTLPVANGGTGATTAAAARTALGLAIGSDVQAYDAELAALAGLVSAADKLPYFTGSGTASLADLSSFARTLIDDASASDARTTLGVSIGSDVQAYDAELAALAGLTSAANKLPMFSGSGTATVIDFLDEDTMSSDSATAVASQQSVKAYVDNNATSAGFSIAMAIAL